ncbi:hypothetical protein RO3G_10845 [Rhizopus delemar RA 99-880]|uniref:Uncharacterized protein n=1 Tax=Rhizopus delemar (strain RA 99-880 / ATCC MYA-4621 / FGSC 9543 / NRRL 43880) TaxID=246409 RepID=I1CCE7_RHIO9|nr:hypothetical protein RO3G_10838 [Rhizopus delemar RA 99-880]EIE86134.1 hypothetical protein RO3G_10845 [Rhizopus delemar RA 99-880]|eukprot:EIE86127.1 hypothetical protein RO3G_10838 [Rhizopus delemar RA 99-880]
MYLANLARDPANPIPVQPSSSAILAIFMLIGVFALVYLRTKSQQAFLASIFGSIILAFSISQASVVAGFQPTIIYDEIHRHPQSITQGMQCLLSRARSSLFESSDHTSQCDLA